MLAALRDRKLQGYLAGNLLSIVGTWAQRVVVFWIAWEMIGSTAVLGVLAALDMAPAVLAAPIAGALADRQPARKLTIVVQLFSMLPPIILAAFAIVDQISLPLLMVLTLCTGLLSGFDHPLRLLLVGSITGQAQVSNAVALNSTVFNIGRMIGPAFGGWMISQGHTAIVFGLNAATFLAFAILLSLPGMFREDEMPKSNGNKFSLGSWVSVFKQMEPLDRRLFLYFASIGLMMRPVFELLPSQAARFTSDVFSEAQAYSLLTSTQGFGALLSAILTSILLSRINGKFIAVYAGLGATLAILAFLFSTPLSVALVALATLSGAVLMNGISTQVMLQTRLPREVRGRALAIYTMTLRGAPALGAFLAGVLGGYVSQVTLFSAAAVLMFVWGISFLRNQARA